MYEIIDKKNVTLSWANPNKKKKHTLTNHNMIYV